MIGDCREMSWIIFVIFVILNIKIFFSCFFSFLIKLLCKISKDFKIQNSIVPVDKWIDFTYLDSYRVGENCENCTIAAQHKTQVFRNV